MSYLEVLYEYSYLVMPINTALRTMILETTPQCGAVHLKESAYIMVEHFIKGSPNTVLMPKPGVIGGFDACNTLISQCQPADEDITGPNLRRAWSWC
jgi:hypothetical protein